MDVGEAEVAAAEAVGELLVVDAEKMEDRRPEVMDGDGMLDGVNAFEMGKICSAVSCNVVASGGISGVEDVQRLVALNCDNLIGAVVGKALYEKTVTVRRLKKAAAQ